MGHLELLFIEVGGLWNVSEIVNIKKLQKGHIQFSLTLFIRGFVLKPKLIILHSHRFNCLI